MLALGRALMSAPRLLMLDEPSLGLAPLMVRDILAIVRGLRDDGVVDPAGGAERARRARKLRRRLRARDRRDRAARRVAARSPATRACRRPTSAGHDTMTTEARAAAAGASARCRRCCSGRRRSATATGRCWLRAARAGRIRDAAAPSPRRARRRCARPASARGDRVALMCAQPDRAASKSSSPAAGSAPSRCRSTPRRWGRRSTTSCATAARGCW